LLLSFPNFVDSYDDYLLSTIFFSLFQQRIGKLLETFFFPRINLTNFPYKKIEKKETLGDGTRECDQALEIDLTLLVKGWGCPLSIQAPCGISQNFNQIF
jgi:hypothetical protein